MFSILRPEQLGSASSNDVTRCFGVDLSLLSVCYELNSLPYIHIFSDPGEKKKGFKTLC